MTTRAKAVVGHEGRDMRNPKPTSAELVEGGLHIDSMRQIVKAMETLHDLNHSTERGHIGITLGAEISLYQGEGNEDEEADQDRLIGWLIQVEDWWEFLPCMPVLHWSSKQNKFVDLETIRAENIAEREAREKTSASA